MQNADPDQRPTAKEAQELFRQAFPEEFALNPYLPSNLPQQDGQTGTPSTANETLSADHRYR